MKKDIKEAVKMMLNTHAMFQPLPEFEKEFLTKLFKYYYDHSNHTKFSFIWDETVSIRYIIIGYNRGEGYTSKGFQISFSNGLMESPSYLKAISSLTKEEVFNLCELI